LNAGGSDPIIVVDLVTGTIKQQFSPVKTNASYDGVIYAKDGNHFYFSQDNGHVIVANVANDGTLTLNTDITLSTTTLPTTVGTVNNGGLALSEDGKTLYVVLNMTNSIAAINLTTNQVIGTIPVQNAPVSIIVVGQFAYVTNQGGRTAKAGDFTVPSAGTAIVADPVSAFSITGTVSVIDLQTNAVVKNIHVGLQPTAILAANGFIYVANTNSDSISVIDPSRNKVINTVRIRAYPDAPLGSFPNSLAFSSRKELMVSLGANNAVAFYHANKEGNLSFKGFVPTAWYPAQVADIAAQTVRHSGRNQKPLERLIIANTKVDLLSAY
jgi:YVTN family beta-propeller protein